MNNKYFVDDVDFLTNNEKSNKLPMFSSLRLNNELFDETENRRHPAIRARRIRLPKNGEDWEVVKDGEVVFRIRGIRLNKKEKSVLRTPEGMNMLIKEYRLGTRSVVKIKKKIKELLDND